MFRKGKETWLHHVDHNQLDDLKPLKMVTGHVVHMVQPCFHSFLTDQSNKVFFKFLIFVLFCCFRILQLNYRKCEHQELQLSSSAILLNT